MVMSVDQARQHHMLPGLKGRCRGGGMTTPWNELDDLAVFHDNTAFGILGKDAKRILDPDRAPLVHHPLPSAGDRKHNALTCFRFSSAPGHHDDD
jgi:hypothetical protein